MKQNTRVFLKDKETAQKYNPRLAIFISEYKKFKELKGRPLKILDIGSGRNPEIFDFKYNDDKYFACDYYDSIDKEVYLYKRIDLNTENLSELFRSEKFDVVFCGEVIEHLFSPDYLVNEIKKIMHDDGVLILSTPNLGYFMNRVMLLFGISPFFLENSSEYKFGRFFKFFGAMNQTEGHIRLFTFAALKEFIKFHDFKILRIISSVGPWNFFLDKIVAKFSKSLSATNVFILKKNI